MKIDAVEVFQLRAEGWTPKDLSLRYGCSRSSIYKYLKRTRKKARHKEPTHPLCHPDRQHEALGLCRQCYAKGRENPKQKVEYYKEYYDKNQDTILARRREHVKNTRRASMLWKCYGITPDQWESLYTRQEGKCAICEKPVKRPHNEEGKRAADTDHDHKTKRIRGLVCHICNRSRVGKNTAATAKKLVVYLESTFDGRNL